MTSKAVGIAVKAEEAVKEELKFEFKSIKESNSKPGYFSFYVDPEYKHIYSWFRLAENDSESVAIQKGHDVKILMIDEKSYKDHTFNIDEEIRTAMEEITLRLKDLGLDIKNCEVIL